MYLFTSTNNCLSSEITINTLLVLYKRLHLQQQFILWATSPEYKLLRINVTSSQFSDWFVVWSLDSRIKYVFELHPYIHYLHYHGLQFTIACIDDFNGSLSKPFYNHSFPSLRSLFAVLPGVFLGVFGKFFPIF